MERKTKCNFKKNKLFDFVTWTHPKNFNFNKYLNKKM